MDFLGIWKISWCWDSKRPIVTLCWICEQSFFTSFEKKSSCQFCQHGNQLVLFVQKRFLMIETIFNFAYSANFWTEKKACKQCWKKHRNCLTKNFKLQFEHENSKGIITLKKKTMRHFLRLSNTMSQTIRAYYPFWRDFFIVVNDKESWMMATLGNLSYLNTRLLSNTNSYLAR